MFSNDNAISTVVSAVMLLGLLVCVTASVNVYYVPSWVRADEAEHLREVFVDFTLIPGVIDDLVLANDTTVVRSQRIVLGSGSIPFVSQGTSWGTFGVIRKGSFTVSADVWVENITEKPLHGNLEGGSVNITGISSVSEFYIDILKIQNVTGVPLTIEDSPKIVINFTNQSGKIEILITSVSLRISTWNGNGNKTIDGIPINCYLDTSTPVNYKIDLLSPCYGFNKVLSDANTPYNLTITNTTDIDGKEILYTIKYSEYNRTIEHYSKTGNGTLIYKSENRRFIDQQFIYQNGAIFLCQPPDVSMRMGSDIVISEREGDDFASVTIPLISILPTGQGRPKIGGSGVEELQMRLDRVDAVSFADGVNTRNVHITIEPPDGEEEFKKNYLDSWVSHFTELASGKIDMTPEPVYLSNYTGINITLNGSIHLEIRDVAIRGEIATISS